MSVKAIRHGNWGVIEQESGPITAQIIRRIANALNDLPGGGSGTITVLGGGGMAGPGKHAPQHADSGSTSQTLGRDKIGPFGFVWTNEHRFEPADPAYAPLTIKAASSQSGDIIFVTDTDDAEKFEMNSDFQVSLGAPAAKGSALNVKRLNISQAGGEGRSPMDLPGIATGLEAWYRTEDITGMVDGDVFVDADPTWLDYSVNVPNNNNSQVAMDDVPGAVVVGPTYHDAAHVQNLNGYPVVERETGQGLVGFGSSGVQMGVNDPFTLIVVYRAGPSTSFMVGGNGPTAEGLQFPGTEVNTVAKAWHLGTDTVLGSAFDNSSGYLGTDNWHIGVFTSNGVYIAYRHDTAAKGSDTVGITAAGHIFMARQNGVYSSSQESAVVEMIYYNSELGTPDIEFIENYLIQKYFGTLSDVLQWDPGAGVDGIIKRATGNMGIGTITPAYKLEVVGSAKVETLQLDLGFADGSVEGRLQWNSEDGTMEYGLPGGNVTLQVGQEMVVKASNRSGVDIANGDVVYINGAQGSRPTIAKADASTHAESLLTGVATEAIADNNDGYVTAFGLVRDVDTMGMAAGSTIWLSATTPGAFTTTKPDAPDHKTIVGTVIFSNVESGVILVHPSVTHDLREASDVLEATPPTDTQILQWVDANDRFEYLTPGQQSWTWTTDQNFNASVKLNFSDSQIYGDGTNLHLVPDVGSNTGKLKIADGVEIIQTDLTNVALKLTAHASATNVFEILKSGGDSSFLVTDAGRVYGPVGTIPMAFYSRTDNVSGLDKKGLFEFFRDGAADGDDFHTKWYGAAGATILDLLIDGRLRFEGNANKEYMYETGLYTEVTFTSKPTLNSGFLVKEIAAPSTPAANYGSIFLDTADGILKIKKDDASVVSLEGAGGGSSPLTTKGDLYGYAAADARVPVGANGLILTADSSNANGVAWAAGGSFSPSTGYTWDTADQTVNDNVKWKFGTGGDSYITYDGGDMVIKPNAVGSGRVEIQGGGLRFQGTELWQVASSGYEVLWSRAGACYNYANAVGGYFIWRTNGDTTARMILSTGGNWQVIGSDGTVSITAGDQVNFNRAGANYFKCTSVGGYFLWYVNGGGAAMYLDTSGNLHMVNDNSTIKFGASDDSQIYFDGSSDFVLNTATATSLSLRVANTEVMRVAGNRVDCHVQFRIDDQEIRFQEQAGPPTPTTGLAHLYLASGTGNLSVIKDTGSVVDLEAGGAGGGNDLAVTAVKTANYTAAAWDAVLVDTSAGTFTVTLPASSAGDQILIKMVGTGDNIVTIDGNGAELLDGVANKTLLAQYESLWLLADGTGWHIVG